MSNAIFRLLKPDYGENGDEVRFTPLGHLEEAVMNVLWNREQASVRDVVDALGRPLAYTTVMTTLDRLYKKSLLERFKVERAFVYSARVARSEWEKMRADELVLNLLGGPEQSRDLVLSCFLDAVGKHDESLLDELERKIRSARKKLMKRRQP